MFVIENSQLRAVAERQLLEKGTDIIADGSLPEIEFVRDFFV